MYWLHLNAFIDVFWCISIDYSGNCILQKNGRDYLKESIEARDKATSIFRRSLMNAYKYTASTQYKPFMTMQNKIGSQFTAPFCHPPKPWLHLSVPLLRSARWHTHALCLPESSNEYLSSSREKDARLQSYVHCNFLPPSPTGTNTVVSNINF